MISEAIRSSLGRSSLIRAMFEEGEKLRKLYGADNVYDFSLGNPDAEPPKIVGDTLKRLLLDDAPGLHKYMSNPGFQDVREKVASYVSKEAGVPLTAKNIIMTSGAAGGMNVILKTILDPDDEVIVFAPYFVDYLFYIDNHKGKGVVVPTKENTFELDPEQLRKHITPKTKGIIINSPNNPTGVVYSEEILQQTAKVLAEKEIEYGTKICVISDEPYKALVYDGLQVPSMLKIFKNCILAGSFSKTLSLPGERIGYIAVNSAIEELDLLVGGLIHSTRVFYVNAPSLFQKVVAESLYEKINTDIYKERRDILYKHLSSLGFSCANPQGAFYLWVKCPIEDDMAFANKAVEHRLIVTPGRGFGCPGYFRISYSVSTDLVKNSLPAFTALAGEYGM